MTKEQEDNLLDDEKHMSEPPEMTAAQRIACGDPVAIIGGAHWRNIRHAHLPEVQTVHAGQVVYERPMRDGSRGVDVPAMRFRGIR